MTAPQSPLSTFDYTKSPPFSIWTFKYCKLAFDPQRHKDIQRLFNVAYYLIHQCGLTSKEYKDSKARLKKMRIHHARNLCKQFGGIIQVKDHQDFAFRLCYGVITYQGNLYAQVKLPTARKTGGGRVKRELPRPVVLIETRAPFASTSTPHPEESPLPLLPTLDQETANSTINSTQSSQYSSSDSDEDTSPLSSDTEQEPLQPFEDSRKLHSTAEQISTKSSPIFMRDPFKFTSSNLICKADDPTSTPRDRGTVICASFELTWKSSAVGPVKKSKIPISKICRGPGSRITIEQLDYSRLWFRVKTRFRLQTGPKKYQLAYQTLDKDILNISTDKDLQDAVEDYLLQGRTSMTVIITRRISE
ncbi:MAG: hypothetical protein Q9170_008293, partial [Blastenia crenularia]